MNNVQCSTKYNADCTTFLLSVFYLKVFFNCAGNVLHMQCALTYYKHEIERYNSPISNFCFMTYST